MTTWSRFYSVRDRVQRHVNSNITHNFSPIALCLRLSLSVYPALCVTLQCFSYIVI